MTIPWTCKGAPRSAARQALPPWTTRGRARAAGARRALTCLVLSALSAAGCGYSQGQLLYLLGVGRGKLVKAQFQLAHGPLLVFVDDPNERVDWPAARQHLADDLAQELLQHGAAKRIVPQETLDQIRQTTADFAKRGCREIGELAGAEQVLWVEARDFLAEEQITDAANAAYFAVSVKVINVLEKEDRARVRLWPAGGDGHAVTVSLGGADAARAKTKDAIAKELSHRLAADIARLFYDHRLGDFGKPQ
ncbi:MAG: hypothetical protein HY763_03885 [Planctomycetes bacterium]|nr:hypothetical protein [Planctomycetota bacterium]